MSKLGKDDFKNVDIVRTESGAAVESELQQQTWSQNAEAKYKKKRDFIIIIFVIDVIMRMVAYLI